MQRVLTIKNGVGAFDVPTFSITENDSLTLKLEIKENFLGYYLFKVRRENGKAKELTFGFKAASEKTVELPLDWLKDGDGDIAFSLILRDSQNTVTYKDDYRIPPLKCEKTPDGNYTFVDKLNELTETVANLLQRVEVAEEKLKEFENEGVPLVFE